MACNDQGNTVNACRNFIIHHLVLPKAKAPGSPVLIVGTFCDQLSSKTLKRCDELRKYIMSQFSTPCASLLVEIKDVVFVECTKRRHPCIIQLQQKLYELAFTVTIPSTGGLVLKCASTVVFICVLQIHAKSTILRNCFTSLFLLLTWNFSSAY